MKALTKASKWKISEIIDISSIEKIKTLFEEYGAKCPVCEKPLKIKVQKPFIYCSECKFIVSLIPKRKIICPKCESPMQLKVHNPFIYCKNCKFLVSLTD